MRARYIRRRRAPQERKGQSLDSRSANIESIIASSDWGSCVYQGNSTFIVKNEPGFNISSSVGYRRVATTILGTRKHAREGESKDSFNIGDEDAWRNVPNGGRN